VSELWLVHGLPPALIERALPFVTIYSGKAEINVFDAPPEVLAALPGMTPARLNSFLDRRESTPRDPEALPLLLGPDQKGATAEGSDGVRVLVRVSFDNGRKTASEAVIMLGATDAPYRVLSWRDDVDAGPDRPQAATRQR
jgi:general secretion pathway protein K